MSPDHDFLDPGSQAWTDIQVQASALGVADALVNLGPLSMNALAEAYRRASLVFLPTLREASTAVYPEAFHFRRPLVTSDIDFARELCGNAALFAPPLDPAALAGRIAEIADDRAVAQRLIEAGSRRLATGYPSTERKFAEQMALLERVAGRVRTS